MLPTPADLTITPRDRRFGRDATLTRLWHGGRVEATAIYNALSTTFPKGEAYFVESVRAFRENTPEKLGREIKAFTTQEAIHSREHDAFNKRAENAGYDLSKLEERVEYRLSFSRKRPPVVALAATMALEHFTAILAHQLLANPRHLEGADKEAAELWRWHAVEEIEHKGVAYDTWLFATRDWPRSKRWKVKAKVMMFVTRNFLVDRTTGALELMRQDGVTGARAWALLLWYLWINPGMFRKIAGAWGKFFLPGFHPWNEDDRHLLAGYDTSGEFDAAPRRKVRAAV
ncbi:metal-dependent hydrolase [Sphingomonas hankyongi]|uniref:Metal-dependent hydrolase n=1 Tax=Sphingomonas hankyongi TaxID=2908209 RepID=A0ABT0S1R2_9SPHN|nr:metal-dependent hydrolase [Sphingomonas hankyongi]MCL6729810.1 metal-dependent hydrolase [Sphingomonas hankyongi]